MQFFLKRFILISIESNNRIKKKKDYWKDGWSSEISKKNFAYPVKIPIPRYTYIYSPTRERERGKKEYKRGQFQSTDPPKQSSAPLRSVPNDEATKTINQHPCFSSLPPLSAPHQSSLGSVVFQARSLVRRTRPRCQQRWTWAVAVNNRNIGELLFARWKAERQLNHAGTGHLA